MGHSLSTRADQSWLVTINAAFVLVLVFQRDSELSGTGFSLALATLPGLIGMNVAMGGWMGTAQTLALGSFLSLAAIIAGGFWGLRVLERQIMAA